MINLGKMFETDFKESCKHQSLWVWRIKDCYVTAKAVDANAYIPCQPSDFLVKLNENIYFCELKATEKNYITVEHDKVRGMIKKSQIDQMKALKADGVYCLLFLQFADMTYAITVENFIKCMEETGKHSINPLDVVQHSGVIVSNCVLRKHRRYDIKQVLTRISSCDE